MGEADALRKELIRKGAVAKSHLRSVHVSSRVRRLGKSLYVYDGCGSGYGLGDGISSLWNRRKVLKFHKTAENVVLLVLVRPRFEQK